MQQQLFEIQQVRIKHGRLQIHLIHVILLVIVDIYGIEHNVKIDHERGHILAKLQYQQMQQQLYEIQQLRINDGRVQIHLTHVILRVLVDIYWIEHNV